jgi:hypothetical protein
MIVGLRVIRFDLDRLAEIGQRSVVIPQVAEGLASMQVDVMTGMERNRLGVIALA